MPTPKNSSFVPKGYEVPATGNDFFKLKTGDNKFRILTDAVVGIEGWKGNKPFRRGGSDAEISPSEVDVDSKSGKPKISNFMAFMVYSHTDEKVMLAEFTQKGIMKAIVEFASDADWGHPSGYDITVTKTGEGLNTKYTVKPSPAKPLAKNIQALIDEESEFFDIEKALSIED